MAFSSLVAGTSSLTANDLVFVAFLDAIKNKARVNLRHWPWNFCSNQTTTSTDDFPTQLAWPDNRISESAYMQRSNWYYRDANEHNIHTVNIYTFGIKSVNEILSTRIVTNVYGNGTFGSSFGILTCWCMTQTKRNLLFERSYLRKSSTQFTCKQIHILH